jgi:hypothetical protein
MSDTPTTAEQEEFQAFLAWKNAGSPAPAAPANAPATNGALCNQCSYDSREPENDAEERNDEEDTAGDTLAALDHNARFGHHVTVRVNGDNWSVNPRTGG